MVIFDDVIVPPPVIKGTPKAKTAYLRAPYHSSNLQFNSDYNFNPIVRVVVAEPVDDLRTVSVHKLDVFLETLFTCSELPDRFSRKVVEANKVADFHDLVEFLNILELLAQEKLLPF